MGNRSRQHQKIGEWVITMPFRNRNGVLHYSGNVHPKWNSQDSYKIHQEKIFPLASYKNQAAFLGSQNDSKGKVVTQALRCYFQVKSLQKLKDLPTLQCPNFPASLIHHSIKVLRKERKKVKKIRKQYNSQHLLLGVWCKGEVKQAVRKFVRSWVLKRSEWNFLWAKRGHFRLWKWVHKDISSSLAVQYSTLQKLLAIKARVLLWIYTYGVCSTSHEGNLINLPKDLVRRLERNFDHPVEKMAFSFSQCLLLL